MATVERAVRRLALEDDEGLLATVLGFEEHEGRAGRRRHLLAATDRRLIAMPVRGGPSTDLALAGLDSFEVAADDTGRRVTARGAGTTIVVRAITAQRDLDVLASLVGTRVARPDGRTHGTGIVRIG